MTDLTPHIQIPTLVPFPKLVISKAEDSGDTTSQIVPHETSKVVLNVVSEFLKHTAPVSPFEHGQIIKLVKDLDGQPIVFSIGTDGRLYCLYYVNGAVHGWQRADVSPSADTTVTHLDVYTNSVTATVHLAAAVQGTDGQVIINHVSFPTPSISYDRSAKSVVGFDPKGTIQSQWKQISNNLGSKKIDTVLCGPGATTSSPFNITIGTGSEGDRVGDLFFVDPSPDAQNPWKECTLPNETAEVLGVDAAVTPSSYGYFVLSKLNSGKSALVRTLKNSQSGEYKDEFVMNITDIGDAIAIFSNVNPWQKTDLFVAGPNGIGFFNFNHLGEKPTMILPGKSFKQVICSEDVDKNAPRTQSKLVVFAVSEHDELYYIEGIRPYSGNNVTFQCSGLPIRLNVDQISTQYNVKNDATELLYVSNDSTSIRHLSRDPVTTCWNEHTLSVPSLDKFVTFQAYVTSITVTDENSRPAPEGYSISLTSEPLFVTVNERTHTLDSQPTEVLTDNSGKISIVLPATEDVLTAPVFNVLLTQFVDAPVSSEIHPAQRVLRKLGSIKSADDLKNATSTTGKQIFANKTQGDLDSSAKLLTNFPGMLQNVDPKGANQILPQKPSDPADLHVAYQKDSDGKVTEIQDHSFMDFIDHAVEEVVHFIGDLWEHVKKAVTAVLKVGLKIVTGILNFVIEVAGKVLKFVIKVTGHLLRAVATFLKDTLGIDITGFLDWLGFIIDPDEIKKTQAVLKTLFTNVKTISTDFLSVNKGTVNDGLQNIRQSLSKSVKDTRPPDPHMDADNNPITKFLHNPIVQAIWKWNPIAILSRLTGEIAEIIEDALDDCIEMPDLSGIEDAFTDQLQQLIWQEIDIVIQFIEDIGVKIQAVISDPKSVGTQVKAILQDLVWTIFDAVSKLIERVYDLLTQVVGSLFDIMEGNWKLPILSPLWDIFAEQDMTILNIGTFLIAGMFNVIVGKPAFEQWKNPNDFLKGIDAKQLDLHDAFGIPKSMSVDPTSIPQTNGTTQKPNTKDLTSTDGNIDNDQVDNDQVDNDQVDNDQMANDQIDKDQIDNDQMANGQTANDQIDNDQVDDDQVDDDQVDDDQVDDDQVDNDQVDIDQADNDPAENDQIEDDRVDNDEADDDEEMEDETHAQESAGESMDVDGEQTLDNDGIGRRRRGRRGSQAGQGLRRRKFDQQSTCEDDNSVLRKVRGQRKRRRQQDSANAPEEDDLHNNKRQRRLERRRGRRGNPGDQLGANSRVAKEPQGTMSSEDYEAYLQAYENYEKWTRWCNFAGGTVRSIACGTELFNSARMKNAKNEKTDGFTKAHNTNKIEDSIAICQAVMAGLCLVSRIMNMVAWSQAKKNQQLAQDITSDTVGCALALAFTSIGTVANCINIAAPAGGVTLAIGDTLLCISTITEMITKNFISNHDQAMEVVEGSVETGASLCGIASSVCDAVKAFEEFAPIFSGIDATLTIGMWIAMLGYDSYEQSKPSEEAPKEQEPGTGEPANKESGS